MRPKEALRVFRVAHAIVEKVPIEAIDAPVGRLKLVRKMRDAPRYRSGQAVRILRREKMPIGWI